MAVGFEALPKPLTNNSRMQLQTSIILHVKNSTVLIPALRNAEVTEGGS